METTSFGAKGGPVSNPNIVPLIDVLLGLFVIFMVITPRVSTGLPTFIPQPPTPQPQPEPDVIVRQVMDGGKLMINQVQTDWDSLDARLSKIFERRADKVAFVQGTEEVPFAQVACAIDIMRQAGVEHVGLIADKVVPAG